MADAKFSFQEKGKMYHPAWIAPEVITTLEKVFSFLLQPPICVQAMAKQPSEINIRAADMWSYAVLLWELATREIPFGDLTPMETGMKVSRGFTRQESGIT